MIYTKKYHSILNGVLFLHVQNISPKVNHSINFKKETMVPTEISDAR